MNNFIRRAPGGRGIFRQRNRQRAQGIKRRAGFGFEFFRCARTGSSATGNPTVASGRVQLRRIASATARRIEDAPLILCFSRLAMYFLKIFDGHAAGRATARDTARSAACRPSSSMRALSRGEDSWRRQHLPEPAIRERSAGRAFCCCRWFRILKYVRYRNFFRRGNIKSKPREFFFGRFDLAERCADGVTFVQLRGKFFKTPATRRRDGHRGFVRFNFDEVLVGDDVVAGLHQKIDDVCLGDGFTELRHDDGNFWHKLKNFYHQDTKAQRILQSKNHKMILFDAVFDFPAR